MTCHRDISFSLTVLYCTALVRVFSNLHSFFLAVNSVTHIDHRFTYPLYTGMKFLDWGYEILWIYLLVLVAKGRRSGLRNLYRNTTFQIWIVFLPKHLTLSYDCWNQYEDIRFSCIHTLIT